MRIERTRVINVDRYLGALPAGSVFRIVCAANEANLQRTGFPNDCAVGSAILPTIRGRVTRFNAEGKFRIRRDLPKENRFVGSREFTRLEWHGEHREEVTDTVDYYRLCYPRDIIPPPSVEVVLAESEGVQFISSPEMRYSPEDEEANKHVMNLMLEVFGSCEIVNENLDRLAPPAVERRNWIMLPPGQHPWDRIEGHIRDVFGRHAPSVVATVLSRQRTILEHGPTTIYRGMAGFNDYLAYAFPVRHLVVLESVRYGNALYVFGDNWEAVSRLTKAEIIQLGLAEGRIVHSKEWRNKLAAVLNPRA